MKKAVDTIMKKFPKADIEKIKIRRGKKNFGKIVAIGDKGGEDKILKDDELGLMKNFLDNFKSKLRPEAEQVISKEREKKYKNSDKGFLRPKNNNE